MWTLDMDGGSSSSGDWAGDQLNFSINLAKPYDGLQKIRIGKSSLNDATLFGLRFSHWDSAVPRLVDCYHRGQDLVATYQAEKDETFHPQFYWRAIESSIGDVSVAGIELILSMQTNLLDTYPTVHVISEMDCDQLLAWDQTGNPLESAAADNAHVFVHTQAAGSLSVAQAIHNADFVSSKATEQDSSRWTTEFEVFGGQHLEKGVIRRSRIQAWFLPTSDVTDTLPKLVEDFSESELPLTT